MKRALSLVVMWCVASVAQAQWPAAVTAIKSEKGKTVQTHGSLDKGAPIADLSWAANSSMACWPATQNEHFRGNHVLFSTELPSRSVMVITVVPDDPKQDLSLWAYTVGPTAFTVPPDVKSCVSCECDQKWDRPRKGKTQDHTRSVRLNAVGNPYNVLIGVTGPKGAVTGGFTLKIDLQ